MIQGNACSTSHSTTLGRTGTTSGAAAAGEREPLGRQVLVSAELAAAVDANCRLAPLGCHALRGVRQTQEIYGLDLG